jgi:hypothetical protein
LTSLSVIRWRFHGVSCVPVARGLASTVLCYKIICSPIHDFVNFQHDLAI